MAVAGWSFSSGADEALVYGNIKDKDSEKWEKILQHANQYSSVGLLIGFALSGFAYTISPGSIFWISGAVIASSFIPLLALKESRSRSTNPKFANEFMAGVSAMLVPAVVKFIPIVVIVWGYFYAFGYGILRPIFLERGGFSPIESSYLLTLANAISLIGLTYVLKRAKQKIDLKLIVSLSSAACLAMYFSSPIIVGVGVVMAIVLEYLITPSIKSSVAEFLPDDQRATALSSMAFIKSGPYILLAPLLGYLSQAGKIQYVALVWGCLMLLCLYILYSRRQKL
jgi:hypothetical protein